MKCIAFDEENGKRISTRIQKFFQAVSAQSAGIHADYVLFDSWFSAPKVIRSMREKDLDVVAMVKKSSKIHYRFQDELLSCKDIYAMCKKTPWPLQVSAERSH